MHSSTKGAPGLSMLEPLVGKWHTEGQQHEGPLGPAAPFVAVETYEWLDGGHFLVHRVEGRFGRQPAACLEILGRNDCGELFAQTYYNDGNSNVWHVHSAESEQTLVLTGSWPRGASESFQIRLTARFLEAGNTLESKWEQSRDGQTWRTFLETRATKAQPLPNASVGG